MDKNPSTTEDAAVLLFDGMSRAEIEVHVAIASYLIPESPEPQPHAKLSRHWPAGFRVATHTTSCLLTC